MSDISKETNTLVNVLKETTSYAPGAIFLISNRKTTYFESVGFSNRETKAKMNKDSALRIGSITKSFVATLAMMATEEGLLNLNSGIDDYLDASVLGKLPKNLNPTVQQLLNHTSGIPDYYGPRFYLRDWKDRGPLTTGLVLHAIRGRKASGRPGEKFNYSNTNYHLVALILEKMYEKSLEHLFREKLFPPLSLSETFYGMSSPQGDDIHGYGSPGRPWNDTYTWQENTGPDGGIFATAADLNKWMRALFSSGGRYSKYAKQMMTNPVYETEQKQQGMGVEILTSRSGTKCLGHTGGLDGYLTAAFYVPVKDTVIVLHVNRSKKKQFGKTLSSVLRYVTTSEEFE